MKRLFTLTLAMGVAAGVSAQTPALSRSHIPVVGDTAVTYATTDTTGISEGPAGASQSWQFTIKTDGANRSESYYISPSEASKASSFPSANLVVLNPGGSEAYWKATDTQVEMVGFYSSSGVLQTYTDPMVNTKVPFTYLDSFTDLLAAEYSANGFPMYRTGHTFMKGDGYGTVEINGTQYNNVLRIYNRIEQRDSFFYSGMSSVSVTLTESYNFVIPGNKMALLNIMYTTLTTDGMPVGSAKSVTYNLDQNTSGMDNAYRQSMALNMYPNPGNGDVNMVFTAEKTGRAAITVADLQGRQLRAESLNITATGPQTQRLDLNGLQPGIYMVQFVLNGQIGVQRLVVE